MNTQTPLQAVAEFMEDKAVLHAVVHGPASGPGSTVVTEANPAQPTVGKVLNDFMEGAAAVDARTVLTSATKTHAEASHAAGDNFIIPAGDSANWPGGPFVDGDRVVNLDGNDNPASWVKLAAKVGERFIASDTCATYVYNGSAFRLTGFDFRGVPMTGGALNNALNASAGGNPISVFVPRNGADGLSKITWPSHFSADMIGEEGQQTILEFTHSDGTQAVYVPAQGSTTCPKVHKIGLLGNADQGHGFNFVGPGVSADMDDVYIRGFSGNIRAGLKLELNYIGRFGRILTQANHFGWQLIGSNGIVARNGWCIDNLIGFQDDRNCYGNDVHWTQFGPSTIDPTKQAMRISGRVSKFSIAFFENHTHPRAIEFLPSSFGCELDAQSRTPNAVYQGGSFNLFKRSNWHPVWNSWGMDAVFGAMAGHGAVSNEVPHSSWGEGVTSARWAAFGGAPSPVVVSIDDGVGLVDGRSAKLTWADAVHSYTSAKLEIETALAENEPVTHLLVVRADRNLAASEAVALVVRKADGTVLDVVLDPNIRANVPSPITIGYCAEEAMSVYVTLGLVSPGGHGALNLNILLECVTRSRHSYTGLINRTGGTLTRTKPGPIFPVMSLQYGWVEPGSGAAAAIGGRLIFISTEYATTANATDQTAFNPSVPGGTLARNDDAIDVRVWGKCAANGNNKRVHLYIGADLIKTLPYAAVNGEGWWVEYVAYRTGAAELKYEGRAHFGGAIVPFNGTVTPNLANDLTLEVQVGNGSASAGDITGLGMRVDYKPGR